MGKEYNISKPAAQCTRCNKQLDAGQELMATVIEADEDLQRRDFCIECWDSGAQQDEAGRLAVWRARVPQPQEKKKLFVDDELLVNFFQRLDGSEEAAKINFRFVLALVLMRKKLLVYDRTVRTAGQNDIWEMHFKGEEQAQQVIDPHMDEDKIAQVSGQLGQILEGEL